jgi:hypothetical protein
MATSQIQLDPQQRQRLARLDETIAYLDRELKKIRKHSELDTRRTRGDQMNHFDRGPHRCTF